MKKILVEPVLRMIYAEKADLDYLQKKRINRSKFFRQAVKALKEGLIKYEH